VIRALERDIRVRPQRNTHTRQHLDKQCLSNTDNTPEYTRQWTPHART
jgi:hypothetical protein